MPEMKPFTYADVTEDPPDSEIPLLNRKEIPDSDFMKLTTLQWDWRENGFIILPKFIPDHLIDGYCADRGRLKRPLGWKCDVPYMHSEATKDLALYQPLMDQMQSLIGYEMALHLCLSGWVSTERRWHSDDYLNPPFVNSHYAAVWIALDNISPDSGPFQFIRGSNMWPLLRRELLFKYMPEEWKTDPSWPGLSQDAVAEMYEQWISRWNAKIESFIPKRGDVLIWSGRLCHQGSKPKVPGTPRKSLICHYSAIEKRLDMPTTEKHPGCGKYFVLGQDHSKCEEE